METKYAERGKEELQVESEGSLFLNYFVIAVAQVALLSFPSDRE